VATRFKAEFYSELGTEYAIHIDDSAFSGTLTTFKVDGDGFRLNYAGENTNRWNPLLGSQCSFGFWVDSATHEGLITDLTTSAEGRFTVKIMKEGALDWVGYILPDIATIEDAPFPYTFNVTATDGIGRLKTIDFKNGSAQYSGWYTFLNLIKEALIKDGLAATYFTTSDIFLKTVCNWYEARHGAAAVDKDPLALTRVNADVFFERDSKGNIKYQSCYDVLEKICTSWNARLYFSGGCYRFEQLNELANGNFSQRNYARNGTYLSSASVNYTVNVLGTSRYRLSGGSYTWFPALRNVAVTYEHLTNKNYLENYWGQFKKINGSNPILISNVSIGTENSLRISGILKVKITSPGSLNYRAVFQLQIRLNPNNAPIYWLKYETSAPSGYMVINADPPTWDANLKVAHISTDFINGGNFAGDIPFTIWTPNVPVTVQELDIDLYELHILDNTGTVVTDGTVVTEYELVAPTLFYVNQTNPNDTEDRVEYKIENYTEGNSSKLELDIPFGDGPKGWTTNRMQSVQSNVWADTTTWRIGGTGSDLRQFGALLAFELMRGSEKPLPKMRANVYGQAVSAHNKLAMSGLVNPGLLIGGEFVANSDEWSGEWFDVVTLSTGAGVVTTTGKSGGTKKGIGTGGPKGTGTVPSDGGFDGYVKQGGGSNIKVDPNGAAALALLSATKTTSAYNSGGVTSIAVMDELSAGAFTAGQKVFLLNPSTGQFDSLIVTADAQDGDMAISVSGSLSQKYPLNSALVVDVSQNYSKPVDFVPGWSGIRIYANSTTSTKNLTVPMERLIHTIVLKSTGSGTARCGTSSGGNQIMRDITYAADTPLIIHVNHWFASQSVAYFSGLTGTTKIWLYAL
jgi:hypothetical protein